MICLSADPFYTNLLSEGKQQFQAGKYDEALESFKLAEFGLLDEKEFVPELYYYYALAQYRQGAMGGARETLDKMKAVLGEAEYARATMPKAIESDLRLMSRVLDAVAQPGARPGMVPFFALYYEAIDLLRQGRVDDAEAKAKQLARMDGDEARRLFLEGMIAFKKDDFNRCLGRLNRIKGPLPAEFGEEASFCLAYAYIKRGDLAAGEKWAGQVKDPGHLRRIQELMEEIKKR